LQSLLQSFQTFLRTNLSPVYLELGTYPSC